MPEYFEIDCDENAFEDADPYDDDFEDADPYDDDEEDDREVERRPTTPEDLERVREYMRTTGSDECDMGGIVDGVLRSTLHVACHAGLNDFNTSPILWARSCGIGLREAKSPWADNTRPAAQAYFAWICGPESPWRSVTKDFNNDLEFVTKHGFVVGDLDTAPSNLVLNFFIATRFATEFASLCDVWYQRVQSGIAPWYALYLATLGGPNSAYKGQHSACTGCSPVALLKGPIEKWLNPAAERLNNRPGDAVWQEDYTPPRDVCSIMFHSQKVNENHDDLVAASIKEQERIVAENPPTF